MNAEKMSLFTETFPHKLLQSSTEVWHSLPENVCSYRGFQSLLYVLCHMPCLHESTSLKQARDTAFSTKRTKAFHDRISLRKILQYEIESLFKLLWNHFAATLSMLCLTCQKEIRAEAVVWESHGSNPTAPIKRVFLQQVFLHLFLQGEGALNLSFFTYLENIGGL